MESAQDRKAFSIGNLIEGVKKAPSPRELSAKLTEGVISVKCCIRQTTPSVIAYGDATSLDEAMSLT